MEKTITVRASEIKRLCKAVGTRYDEQDMSATVINLLDMSLNDMSDEDFDRLPYKMRMKLGSFAAAVQQGGLEVVDGTIPCISRVIRECVQNGVTSYPELKKHLDKKISTITTGRPGLFSRGKKNCGARQKKTANRHDDSRAEVF